MRIAWKVLGLLAFAAAAPIRAGDRARAFDIAAQPLAAALREFARQSGADLLFDPALAGGYRSARVHGRYDIQAALEHMLGGTTLTVRHAASGAWVIASTPPPPPGASPALAEPEILVIGRRTQNFDIQRREDDIQPYRIATGGTVTSAHTDNLDQYFRERLTANTEYRAPFDLSSGATNSEINLRGLGPDSTLVLIDGRRMPGIPSQALALGQPDLNGIPLHAIDRVETLMGTASGIYGFGALGGVVNVVLRRDYRGFELTTTGGISARGDGQRLGIEGRVGFTPDGGRTDVMIYASHVTGQPLRVGDRPFTERNLTESYRNVSAAIPGTTIATAAGFPSGTTIGVYSLESDFDPGTFTFTPTNLTLKPQYGGIALPSNYAYLPPGFGGNPADLAAALAPHVGQADLSLTPDQRRSQLDSNPTITSVIINVRHRFGDAIEGYFDGLLFRNHGKYAAYGTSSGLVLSPDDPANPFQQEIEVQFPAAMTDVKHVDIDSERFTGGLIVQLPWRWRGTAEATFGRSRYATDEVDRQFSYPFVPNGGYDAGPTLYPFGSWAALQQAMAAYMATADQTWRATNHYQDQSLQLAGPLYRTAAGPATLTVSFERHREAVGTSPSVRTSDLVDDSYTAEGPPHASTTGSVHAELKSQIFGNAAPFVLLRGLEVQLAARYDSQKVAFSSDIATTFVLTGEPATPAEPQRLQRRFAGADYTAGAKIQPLPWLMLRTSYATGRQPPPLADLIPFIEQDSITAMTDPKRGGDFVFGDGTSNVIVKSLGSMALKAIRASTLSAGFVLTPGGARGPRLSLDYSRIRKTRDVYFFVDPQAIVDNEARFPTRVVREPLTPADAALGYTGGIITEVDATAMNAARTSIDTIDGAVGWTVPFLRGGLHVYATATLQLHDLQHGLFGDRIEQVNYLEGPLKWRANGGVDWSRDSVSIGANLQYYGHYRIYPGDSVILADTYEDVQGSAWVPSQIYLDLYVARRFAIGGPGSRRAVNVSLGISNVFNKLPPFETDIRYAYPDFSRYGDPRLRRFELTVTATY